MKDSLAQATSTVEKTKLSLSIAETLQNSNWERTLHYLDVAKKTSVNSNDTSLLAEVYLTTGNIYSNKDALI